MKRHRLHVRGIHNEQTPHGLSLNYYLLVTHNYSTNSSIGGGACVKGASVLRDRPERARSGERRNITLSVGGHGNFQRARPTLCSPKDKSKHVTWTPPLLHTHTHTQTHTHTNTHSPLWAASRSGSTSGGHRWNPRGNRSHSLVHFLCGAGIPGS